MKQVYIKYFAIGLLGLIGFSCSNDDGQKLFSNAPAERIDQKNNELLNILTSEAQGFKGVYFTKNNEFGGFTFYMKFNKDGTVDMTSDFDFETGIETSSFEVRFGTTNELVFTTRNHIQKVSDPSFSGLVGSGFKGTSVFQYFSNQNGALVFRDIRNKDEGFFQLVPSGFANFESESVANAKASIAQRENLVPTAETSVFQVLTIENSNGTSSFNFNYDSLRLFASPRITFDDGTVTEFNFGLSFTADGMIISPSLNFEGETYEEFLYDNSSSSYISEVNGTTARISFSNEPAFFKDDVNALGSPGRQTFGSIIADGTSPLTSLGFIDLLEALEAGVKQISGYSDWSYTGFVYLATPDASGSVRLDILFNNPNNQEVERAIYLFTPVIQDRRLFLSFTGRTNQLGIDLFEPITPMLQFFASPQGLYYSDEGSFVTDTSAFGNSSATFTSLSEPNLRVYGLWYN